MPSPQHTQPEPCKCEHCVNSNGPLFKPIKPLVAYKTTQPEPDKPTIDWLIDQIQPNHSPLIDFNKKRLRALIDSEVAAKVWEAERAMAPDKCIAMVCSVTGCSVAKAVLRESDDPRDASSVTQLCPRHDAGDFDGLEYYDENGNEVWPDDPLAPQKDTPNGETV